MTPRLPPLPLDTRIALDERSRGRCEACGRHRGASGVVHHRKLRAQGGTHDPANLMVLHDGCHRFAHANPAWAMAHGWIVSGWGDPATTPVRICLPAVTVCAHLDPPF